MAKVKWRWNVAGFAELRNHPALVSAMESAMRSGAAGTPFEVEVWAHRGRKAGPRTVVQAWARTPKAMRLVEDNPGAMHSVLAATGVPFQRKSGR